LMVAMIAMQARPEVTPRNTDETNAVQAKTVAQLRGKLGELQGLIEAKNQKLEERELEVAQLRSSLAGTRANLAGVQRADQAATRRAAQMSRELASMKGAISQRDEQIRQLNDGLKKAKDELLRARNNAGGARYSGPKLYASRSRRSPVILQEMVWGTERHKKGKPECIDGTLWLSAYVFRLEKWGYFPAYSC